MIKKMATKVCVFLAMVSIVMACIPDENVKVCPATVRTDLVFVIDSATSEASSEFNFSIDFIATLVHRFTVGDSSQKVAVLTHGETHKVLFPLTASKDTIYQALRNARGQFGTHNTQTALMTALSYLKSDHGGREGVNKTIVLLTDGKSTNRQQTDEAVSHVKNQYVTIFTIGVTSKIDKVELNAFASRLDYSFQIAQYGSLNDHANLISMRICNATAPTPVKPCPPVIKVDIYFLVDSSGSIGIDRYKYNFDFISRLLTGYFISPDSAEVALATYGTSVRQKFKLSGDPDFVEQSLQNVSYQGSTTNTHLALQSVYNSVLNFANTRPDAKNVIVLITDGYSSAPELTLEAAALVKSLPITVVAVGVSRDVNKEELLAIASSPHYVFTVNDYNLLDSLASRIADIACHDDPKRTGRHTRK